MYPQIVQKINQKKEYNFHATGSRLKEEIFVLAFLRPGYSDIIRMTTQGRASFRRMRNGEGEKLGGHTFEPLS